MARFFGFISRAFSKRTKQPEWSPTSKPVSPAEIAHIFDLMELDSAEQRAVYRDLREPPYTPGYRISHVAARPSNSSEPAPQVF